MHALGTPGSGERVVGCWETEGHVIEKMGYSKSRPRFLDVYALSALRRAKSEGVEDDSTEIRGLSRLFCMKR